MMKMLIDIDLRDHLLMEPLAINFFFHHLGPLLSFGDKPDVDIFLCADSLTTRLQEPMFILFTINPVSLATRLWEPMFILFTINPVFSWIYSHYGTEIILQNEKGLIVVVRTCNRNRFHKQEQNIGIVYVKEQWEQSSLDDVYTRWTSK